MRLSVVEILSFLVVFGLMCFGLGVIFMRERRLKELTKEWINSVAELPEERKKLEQEYQEKTKELEKEFEQRLIEAIVENVKNLDSNEESAATGE